MSDSEPLFANAEACRAFAAELPTRAVGCVIEHHRRVGSTNDLAAAAARHGAPHGWAAVADEQTAGRGRRGRQWLAPPRRALLFSLVLRGPGLQRGRLGWVGLAAGVAVAEALDGFTALHARVKWPNDVVLVAAKRPGSPWPARPPWRKLGGVLVENVVSRRAAAPACAVLGIGLNVLQRAAELPVLATPATSILLENGRSLPRLELFAALLTTLDARLKWIHDGHGFPELREDLRRTMKEWWQDWVFQAATPEGPAEGRFAGLDAQAALRLEGAGGSHAILPDAEITGGRPGVRGSEPDV